MDGRAVRRRIVAITCALALAAPACGLVGGDEEPTVAPSSQPTLPAAAAVLRASSTVWPACLNPLTCRDEVADWLVWEHVLPRLVEVGPDGEHRPSPVLAGMPEVRVDRSTGHQTITYVIAEQARWHDGRPITSSDITGTWMAYRATPGAPTAGYELITAVDDRDPSVARVTLRQPYADWPELFGGHTGWLLQADAFDGVVDLTDRFDDELGFGAGPFELRSFDERAITLVARDDHWDGDRQASVDQVRIERLPVESADALEASVSGAIDLVVAPGAVDVPERFQAQDRPTAEVIGLFLDRRSAPLGSQAVREAVDAAVDRRLLLDALGADEDDLVGCLGALPQSERCIDALPESPASAPEAEALLDGDGWLRDPAGPRGRPDVPLLLPISYDPALPGAEAVAGTLRQVLEPLGFATVVQATDAATWLQGDRTGSTGIGVFAASLGTAGRVAALYRCELGAVNPMAWCEAQNQELARTLVATPDRTDQASATADVAALAARTVSWLPLAPRTVPLLVDPSRVDVPSEVPVGSGPLGGLHRFGRIEG